MNVVDLTVEQPGLPSTATDRPDNPYHREDSDHWSGPGSLQFVVLLRQRPVTIKLSVLIDRRPYQSIRDEEIFNLLSELSESPAVDADDRSSTLSSEFARRVRRYISTTGRVPDDQELRWLMKRWNGGAGVLRLRDTFEAGRAAGCASLQRARCKSRWGARLRRASRFQSSPP